MAAEETTDDVEFEGFYLKVLEHLRELDFDQHLRETVILAGNNPDSAEFVSTKLIRKQTQLCYGLGVESPWEVALMIEDGLARATAQIIVESQRTLPRN